MDLKQGIKAYTFYVDPFQIKLILLTILHYFCDCILQCSDLFLTLYCGYLQIFINLDIYPHKYLTVGQPPLSMGSSCLFSIIHFFNYVLLFMFFFIVNADETCAKSLLQVLEHKKQWKGNIFGYSYGTKKKKQKSEHFLLIQQFWLMGTTSIPTACYYNSSVSNLYFA